MKPVFRGTICADIDGVLADFEGSFCDKFGSSKRDKVNLFERYPQHSDLINEFIASPDSYKDLAPIFGGLLLVKQAKSRGYQVDLVSGRPVYTKEITEEWLKRYNVHYDNLAVGVANKAEYLGSYHTKPILFIDDMSDNLGEVEGIGVKTMLWSQPWNRNSSGYRYMTYNSETMKLLVFDTVSGFWVDFWTGE